MMHSNEMHLTVLLVVQHSLSFVLPVLLILSYVAAATSVCCVFSCTVTYCAFQNSFLFIKFFVLETYHLMHP